MKSLLTLAAFKFTWLSIVFGAVWSRPWLGLLAVGAFAGYEIVVRGRNHLIAPVLIVAACGFAVDNAYVAAGLLRFRDPSLALAPVWMALLWVNFALIVEDGLSWLQGRPWLAAVLGGVGGPGAYLAGIKFGLIEFIAPGWVVLGVIGALWAIALPTLVFALGTRVTRARDGGEMLA
jgi:hypothetical protein